MEIEKFGKTASEKDAEDMFKCREIVREIMDFGVTEKQIVQIVKLLGLEIPDHNHSKKIVEAAKSIQASQNTTIHLT